MLRAINITQRYGNRVLFENINLEFTKGKRYGLIGANGAGKTTFLKILSGEIEPTSGEISVDNGVKIGVLSQNQFAFEDFTLKDAVLYGNKRLYEATKEKEKLYAEGDFENEKINNRLSELEIICAEEDPMYEHEIVIEKMLEELGFNISTHNNLVSTLKGGDRFKILLAQVLYPNPGVLFLDEPTNNLDLEAIAWLEDKLKRHEGTLIVISHDRHFLNSVVTHILDVDYKKIREFTGNYNDWYIASQLVQKQAEIQRNKKLKEKEELESFIRRFSANASKAKQATSRQRQLDKINIDDLQTSSRREPSIVFKQKREIGNEALEIVDISKSYGDLQVLKNLSLKFEKGEKVAIIGLNGIGKSTLCKILVNELKPDSGQVNWGATVEYSYFPQDTTDRIKGNETLYQWLENFDKKRDLNEIRSCLGRMLFSGEEQQKNVQGISGGEKHRMMISKIMLEEGNFLVFDEPTNHLDLEAIIALGEAFRNFKGTVICISHDRELIDSYATRIIELKPKNKIVDFKGSYEEYLNIYK